MPSTRRLLQYTMASGFGWDEYWAFLKNKKMENRMMSQASKKNFYELAKKITCAAKARFRSRVYRGLLYESESLTKWHIRDLWQFIRYCIFFSWLEVAPLKNIFKRTVMGDQLKARFVFCRCWWPRLLAHRSSLKYFRIVRIRLDEIRIQRYPSHPIFIVSFGQNLF